jgi:RNA polymerase sigma factor (sigma-70 family)
MSSPAACSNLNTDALIREVFEKEYLFLVKVATRKLRNPELSRDAVQNAFIRAWQSRHQYKGTARAGTWITKILINECFGMMRKQACRTIGHEDPMDGLSVASTTPGPEELAYGSMRDRELLQAKRALPEILGNAIEVYLSGVKISHNGAYKSAKHRAQLVLRQSMRDKGY